MDKLLIGNGRMVTRDPSFPYWENGALLIVNSRIEAVGETNTLRVLHKDAEFVDARGGVIMPGLINTHHHIYSALARGMKTLPARDFMQILETLWWRLDKTLSLEDIALSAYTTLLDCVQNGVTTYIDHHASQGCVEGSLQTIADASHKMGLRGCLCYEVSDRDGEWAARQGIAENANFIRHCTQNSSQNLKALFGLHAAFTLSDATLERCAAMNPGVGYHVHVSEAIDDLGAVTRLDSFGMLGRGTLAVHCVHATEEEQEILKGNGTHVIHNPQSNMGNAVGSAPVTTMFANGISLGLGTDGYTSDMLESFKTAGILQRHTQKNPRVGWAEIPHMLFDENAKIASDIFGTELGVLRAGAAGDVIVLDYDPPTPMNADNIDGHILFGMSGRQVVTTICQGKILMRDREVLIADAALIRAKTREQTAKLWERMQI